MPATKMKIKVKGKKPKKQTWYKHKYQTTQIGPNVSQIQVVKMVYGALVNISSTNGTPATYIFRANSIYDPDYTSTLTGHQPSSHDQWAPFYNHYSVISARIRVDFLPITGDAFTGSFLGAIRISGESTVPINSMTQMIENRQIKSGLQIVNGNPLRLYHTYVAKKQFGIRAQLGNTLSAQFGSNPEEDVFFQVCALPTLLLGSVQANIIVKIEYTVRLMEPRTLAQS